MKHKGKAQTESEKISFTVASGYLKKVLNGNTTLPTKAWSAERVKLTAERKRLDKDYANLKNEVKEAEQIRKSVYSIMRQEQRERQPRRARNMER